ncbi:DUF3971 domain-containing protein [Burkholderia sp. WAC0059]|uniref:YhdP family phospholipid transporter n=1 Tax=Burkholderia sp. WAC0059 TaxID=2066022 RepID=UPI000C7F6145|nr:AsmA-like C-terminal region-containing protein [Burkholderia sp. WAC0059]PLZ03280.1 DUF3971 domain-containing protein [Burkholderia sp. WAC0059]
MSERNDSSRPPTGQRASAAAKDHAVLRHLLRAILAAALVAYFVAAALYFGLRYAVLPHVDDWRPRIEALVSDRLHAQVRIGKLSPRWSGFQPGVDIANLTIRDPDGTLALNVPHASASIAWRSLVEFAPLLSSLAVDRPDVLIERDAGGALRIAGVPAPGDHTGNPTFTTWLMRQQAIVLRGGTLRWRDATRSVPELALRHIRLAILNDGDTHRFALQAPAEGTVLHGPLDFRARFRDARLAQAGNPANWSGEAYLSTGPVDLPTLARYVRLPITTYAGRIDNAIWVDFAGGRLTSASGRLDGTDVALRVRATQPRLNLPVAHFDWQLHDRPGDYTLHLAHLRAELSQPPLEDGTPVIRTLALATLDARFRQQSASAGQLFSVRGDRIDLGLLAEFMRALPLPERVQDELVRFDPRGLVANYDIAVERARPPDAGPAAAPASASDVGPIIHYRFKADLQGISVAAQEPPPGLTRLNHPHAGLPGFENLWGRIDADETRGTLTLDTADAAVTLPGLFDNPRLTFDRLNGAASWTVAPQPSPGEPHKAFQVNVARFGLQNADLDATLAAHYTNPGHGRGALELTADLARVALHRIPHYLPTSVNEKLRTFLGHALVSGNATGATVEVRGDLDQFPYTRDPTAGRFRVVAPFSAGRFDPSPYPLHRLRDGTPDVWPAFDGIDGVFRIRENLLRFDIARARYRNVVLANVNGRIGDLGSRASDLVISGTGRGPLADMLDYTNRSTLAALSNHAGEKVHAQGPATLALTLAISRALRPAPIGVKGALGFRNDQLETGDLPPVSNLTGQVRFTNRSAQLERVAGRFLGGAVRATGGLRGADYAFNVSGQVAVDAARGLNLHGPVAAALARMSGSAPYAFSLRGTHGHLPDITASSDLTDLALDLPAPFGKAAGTPMPFSFSFTPGPADAMQTGPKTEPKTAGLQQANLRFGPLAAAYVLSHVPGQPPQVVRGAIGLNRPADLPADGVSATADLPAFDADAWAQVVRQWRDSAHDAPAGETAGAESARPSRAGADAAAAVAAPASAPFVPTGAIAQYLPSRFAVHVGTLTLLERHWENLVIGASRSGNQWQANVASNQMSGHLDWQPGAAAGAPGTLRARLARLVVPAATDDDLLGQAISTPAQNMPAIDLVVNQLIVRNHDLGELHVNAHNFDENGVPVWQLDTLDLDNPAARLTATANWRTGTPSAGAAAATGAPPRRTALDFRLDIRNAGALLDRAGLPRTVAGGAGVLSGKVDWRGGPTAIDYPTLDGNLNLDLHQGQILKVDPGAAKLLGVLSLQGLARFATLNFRSVLGKGLPFASMTGSAQIRDGIGSTHDFRVVASPVRVDMAGSVDLARETQALHVHVTPTVRPDAAVVAAAAINPLLGLGALAADFALSHSIAAAFAFDYAITGSWSQPHVERLRGDQGKMDAQTPMAAR